MRRPTPAAEIDIDASLVQSLLEDQHPDLAALPLTPVGAGWDNAIFRLGDSLAVRLPRRALAAPLLLNEQRWLSVLAPRLPLSIPAAVRVGTPGRGYPWSWSVTPWFEGRPVSEYLPATDASIARALGGFLRALHVDAPADAPRSAFRGLPLEARNARLHEHVRELDGMIDRSAVLSRWDELLRAPPWPGPPVWLHGDLHPGNLLIRDGQLAAVIDFGDLTAGDPATDLATAWMVFAPEVRQEFRRAAAGPGRMIDADTWDRARGWALSLNLAWLAGSADDEELTGQGLATIAAVLEDR